MSIFEQVLTEEKEKRNLELTRLKVKYKDIDILPIDKYYKLAEEILEEPEITFIFAGTKEYINELIDEKNEYNIKIEDIENFLKIFLMDASELYEEFLYDSSTFNKLDILEQAEIIYLFLKKELPDWLYDETEYKDDNNKERENESNEPYDISKIDIINQPLEIESLYRMYKLKPKELELSPDYQRNFVWKPRQRSKLIESILIRIPLPTFYIDTRNEDQWIVIDGLQRLTSIFTYIDNEYKLINLQYLTHLNGKKWKDLDRKYQRKIEKFSLLCNLVRPNTPSKIASNIFQRINTLGTKLEVQEIRNAMFRGKSTKLLKKMAESNEFINIITRKRIKGYSNRMEDHAIILRYLSFKITNYLEYRKNDMNEFLEDTMDRINNMGDLEIKSLENTFLDCMKKAQILFDKEHFLKPSKREKNTNQISKTLFESICYTLDKYSFNEIEKNQALLLEKIYEIYKNDEFILKTSLATNNPPQVKYRFDKFKEIFKEVIGH
ncbi:DUF262 domain-containing protein [Sulfurimonas sp.]|uniref:DUF262 domain-containing protein n=1 Tax=Sulfurimonas sp. TaxID=2022749 RepID=UPI0035637435